MFGRVNADNSVGALEGPSRLLRSFVHVFVHRPKFLRAVEKTWDTRVSGLLPTKKQVRAVGRTWAYFSRARPEPGALSS